MWYILGGENTDKINIHDLSVFVLAIFGIGLGMVAVRLLTHSCKKLTFLGGDR